jgi:Fur family peroxide stress response transcriptional regulator
MHHDPVQMDRQMHELMRRCRDEGMNVTPQRAAIYRALLESEDHPSPEVLYRRVHRRLPSLSLATVYKALDTLVALGLVREVDVAGDAKRYDANLDRHHHMICTGCRRVTDFSDESLDAAAPSKRFAGFVARTVSVQVFGLCTACARKNRH